jgi:hypothetical protein
MNFRLKVYPTNLNFQIHQFRLQFSKYLHFLLYELSYLQEDS